MCSWNPANVITGCSDLTRGQPAERPHLEPAPEAEICRTQAVIRTRPTILCFRRVGRVEILGDALHDRLAPGSRLDTTRGIAGVTVGADNEAVRADTDLRTNCCKKVRLAQ